MGKRSQPTDELVQDIESSKDISYYFQAQCIFVLLLGILSFVSTLKNPFLSEDFTLANKIPHPSDSKDVWITFLSEDEQSFRPFSWILLERLWFISSDARLFRFLSIILHGINSVLVLCSHRALHSLFDGWLLENHRFSLLLSSTLFAIHPLHSEVISSFTGLGILTSTFLFLCSFLFFMNALKISKPSQFIVSGVFFLIATLFNRSLLWTLPVPFILLSFENPRRFFFSKSFLLFLFAVTLILYVHYQVHFAVFWTISFHPHIFSSTFLFLHAKQLNLFFFPFYLSVDHCVSAFDLIPLLVLCFVYLSLFFFWRRPVFMLAFTLFVCSLFSQHILLERTLYLGSVGLSIAFAESITISKYLLKSKMWIFLLFSLLLLGQTFLRNEDWTNEERIFSSALKVCPNSVKAHSSLALLAYQKGDFENALSHFESILKLEPRDSITYYRAGLTVWKLNQNHEAALSYLSQALKFRHPNPSRVSTLFMQIMQDYEISELDFEAKHAFFKRFGSIEENFEKFRYFQEIKNREKP